MTLTEQWKKGELPTGDYYVKPKNGQVFVYHINHSVKHIYHNHAGEIKEVLAPVLSYEECQELSKQRNQLIRDVKDLAYIQEENQQLKELLKKCRTMIGILGAEIGTFDVVEIMLKIDNAIGEKK